MESARPKFRKYLFVCENEREDGVACNPPGARIRELLKNAVKERGLASKVRVSRAGCLDTCSEGPNVLLVPEYIWFKRVSEKDIDAILARAIEGD